VDLIGQVVAWFSDPGNWSGTSGIPNRTLEHLVLSAVAIITAILVAVPAGLAIGHTGKGAFMTVSVANLGRSIPSYALLIIFVIWFGIGFAAAYPVLVVLAIPPILTNTYVGVRQVDPEVIDASRGMGLRAAQVITRVELPLAVNNIFGGIRTSAVNVVATATIAPLAGVLTLGDFILSANVYGDDGRLAGAILVALLALTVEGLFALLQRAVTPRGLRAHTG